MTSGLDGMHDYEMLELLLTYVIPQRDTKPIAKELIEKFGSISGVMEASVEDLKNVKWITEKGAILFHMLREMNTKYLSEKSMGFDVLSSPESVISFSRMKLVGEKDEKFMVIYLNTKNHVLNHYIESIGTVDQAAVYPRNIAKRALEENASGLIVVHNHPSGVCNPSADDVRLTKAIKDALSVLNIKLLDHLIVGKSGHFSFVEENLI